MVFQGVTDESFVSLWPSMCTEVLFPIEGPKISSTFKPLVYDTPVHKPIKKGLRTCISLGLVIGGLRYLPKFHSVNGSISF